MKVTCVIGEAKHHDVYGKRQTVGSCVSQSMKIYVFQPVSLTLLRSYSIYLGNRQERSLRKSSFSVFLQIENFILPFAVNVMLNLSFVSIMRLNEIRRGCENAIP